MTRVEAARLAAKAALAWGLAISAGCATNAAAPAAAHAAPAALAPTGKLRVGLYSGSPTSLVGDAASADARGVSFDLGRELARRMGGELVLAEGGPPGACFVLTLATATPEVPRHELVTN